MSYARIDTTTGALSVPKSTAGPAGSAVGYASVVVAPGINVVYSFYFPTDALETFAMKGPAVQLTWRAEAVFPLESSMVLHPGGKFLYVFQAGTGGKASIQEMSVNNSAGSLTAGAIVTEDADLRLGVFDPSGQFLFVNDSTGGRIFVYQINQTNGALTPVSGSPYSLPPNELPTMFAIGGSGTSLFLYIDLDRNTGHIPGIDAFSIDASSGKLTAVAGSPFQTEGYGPDFICAEPSGKFLYSASSLDGSINGFVIDPSTGALNLISGSPYATAPPSGSMAVDPAGKYLYVTNYKNSTIYGFRLDSSVGALSPIDGSPFAAVPQPEALVMMKIP